MYWCAYPFENEQVLILFVLRKKKKTIKIPPVVHSAAAQILPGAG